MGNVISWLPEQIQSEPFRTVITLLIGVVGTKKFAISKYDSDYHSKRTESLNKIISKLEEYDKVFERLLPLNQKLAINAKSYNPELHIGVNDPLLREHQSLNAAKSPLITDGFKIWGEITFYAEQYGKLPRACKYIAGDSLAELVSWEIPKSVHDMNEADTDSMRHEQGSITRLKYNLRNLAEFEQEQARNVIADILRFRKREPKVVQVGFLDDIKEDMELQRESWEQQDKEWKEEQKRLQEEKAKTKVPEQALMSTNNQ